MAETTAAFQADAFDFGFDIYDIIPVLFKVVVEPEYGKIKAGQTVSIFIYIIDNSSTPGKKYPFTLVEPPRIQLFNPSDSSILSATAMVQSDDGVYRYTHITNTFDPPGPYSPVFTATNGTSLMNTKKQVAFTII